MGNAIGKLVEELVELFKRNYKRPKLWISLFLLVVIFILLLPYIDSNFFYYSRMEKRIKILEQIMELNQEKVNSNPAYIKEYQNILQEMDQQSERSINSLMNKIINQVSGWIALNSSVGNTWGKFISGALWFIIVTICVPFMNTFKKRSDKFLAFGLMVCLTIIVGVFFSIIPVIITPWINYVVFPLGQIIFIFWLVNKNNKKKKDKGI